MGYSAGDLLNLSMNVSFNKLDYQMPGALTKAQMEQDRRQYQPGCSDDDGSDKYTNVNLGVKSFWGSWGQFEVNFLYGKKDLQMNMMSWSSPWFRYAFSDTDADTYGITPKYILEKEIFGFHNKVIAGVDYYREPYKKDIFSDRERRQKLSTADFTRESTGYYLRDEFSILSHWILNAGYRFERTSIEGSNEDFYTPSNTFANRKNTYDAEAYEVGLTWLLGKQSKMFAKYSTVYRIPFIDEIASFNGGAGLFLTHLEKEKGASMEAGTEIYPLENLKLALTLFRIDMEEEIQYVGYFPTGYNQNTGKTRHDGVEISLSYSWPKYFRLYGNYTYHMATFENGVCNKKEMPMVPNHMANAGVEIYLPFHLSLRAEIQYAGKAFLSGDNDNNTEKLDDYTLLNLYAQYKLAWGNHDFTAFLGVDNVADVKYSSFGMDYAQYGMSDVYYPMPGITFKGGMALTF